MDASTELTTWSGALAGFEAELRRKRRRYSTIKGYRSHLDTLATMHDPGPWSVEPDVLATWLVQRGASRTAAWKVARVFYQWGLAMGLVAASPVPVLATRRSPVENRDTINRRFPGSWADSVQAYSTRMRAAGKAPRTIALHLAYLRQLADVFPSGPSEVTADGLTRWLARDGWAPETRRSARSVVRLYFAAAVDRGHVAHSPADHLDRVRVPRALPRPASNDAFARALRTADDRQRLMLVLGAYAGLRAAEIAAVRPATDMQDGFLFVRGKGGHQRTVPIHPAVASEIAAELARRRAGQLGSGFRYYADVTPDGWLFPSPNGAHVTPGSVSHVLGRLLPDHWTAHTLRHRFASQAYDNTRDLRTIQELLGHSSPVTTARYTAISNERMRAAVASLS